MNILNDRVLKKTLEMLMPDIKDLMVDFCTHGYQEKKCHYKNCRHFHGPLNRK